MKIDDIRKLSTDDIEKKIVELKRELLDLRIKQATGTLEKPVQIRELKKTVARLKTILNERKLSIRGEK